MMDVSLTGSKVNVALKASLETKKWRFGSMVFVWRPRRQRIVRTRIKSRQEVRFWMDILWFGWTICWGLWHPCIPELLHENTVRSSTGPYDSMSSFVWSGRATSSASGVAESLGGFLGSNPLGGLEPGARFHLVLLCASTAALAILWALRSWRWGKVDESWVWLLESKGISYKHVYQSPQMSAVYCG